MHKAKKIICLFIAVYSIKFTVPVSEQNSLIIASHRSITCLVTSYKQKYYFPIKITKFDGSKQPSKQMLRYLCLKFLKTLFQEQIVTGHCLHIM